MSITLVSIFERKEAELRNNLEKFVIPRDIGALQKFIANFFSEIVEGEYKDNLTVNEAFFVSSSVKFIFDQASLFSSDNLICSVAVKNQESAIHGTKQQFQFQSSVDTTKVLVKIALGALIGAFSGAIFQFFAHGPVLSGVVLGTGTGAMGAAVSCLNDNSMNDNNEQSLVFSLNVDNYVYILKGMCRTIDDVVFSYKNLAHNLKDRYDVKVTLASSYLSLLECLSKVFMVLRELGMSDKLDDKHVKDVLNIANYLSSTLDSYGYRFVDYCESNAKFYDLSYTQRAAIIELPENEDESKAKCIVRGLIRRV